MRLILVRHGETEWSKAGRHTGRTDLALTAHGEIEAAQVAPLLDECEFVQVYSSPLLRARQTARLAGFDPTLADDLMEWHYGDIEGRTNAEIVAERPGWSKWTHDVPDGETAEEVGARADRFIDLTADASGDVLVFAHGHLLAILTARWLGLEASEGRRFPLATATVSVLSCKRDDHIIETLNHGVRSLEAGLGPDPSI